jgi:hypothetical protein
LSGAYQSRHEVRVLAHRAAAERVRATGAKLIEIERAVPDFDISRRETDTLPSRVTAS